MTEQTEFRLSAAKKLKPRRCAACSHPEKPRWADASGAFDDDVDPMVVVSYECSNLDCDHSFGL
ncbi:hypothetical protein [Streptomyces venezuelae]